MRLRGFLCVVPLLVGLGFAAACGSAPGIAQATPSSTRLGTTYYVSPDGSDGNSGKDKSSPWKTISRVNSFSFGPCDLVLLQRGGVWHETLNIPRSGSADCHWSIDAYGAVSTDLPTLDAATLIAAKWTLSPGLSNTWQTPYTLTAAKAFVDGKYTEVRDPIPPVTSPAALNSAVGGGLYSDGSTLYLRLPDGSDPNRHVVEVTDTAHSCNVCNTDHSYFSVQNVRLIRSAGSGFSSIQGTTNSGGLLKSEFVTARNLQVFNYGLFSPSGMWGGVMIHGWNNTGQTGLSGVEVTDNYIGRMDTLPVLHYFTGGIFLGSTEKAVIRHNTVRPVNGMGIATRAQYRNMSCSGNTIDSNDIADFEGGIQITDCAKPVTTKNKVHDGRGSGTLHGGSGTTGAYFADNEIWNLTASTDGKLYNGEDCNSGAKDGKAIGNRIWKVAGSNFTLEADHDVPCSGWTIMGNTLDASNNVSYNNKPCSEAFRCYPLFIRNLAISGLVIKENKIIYSPGSPYIRNGGVTSSDKTHDVPEDVFTSTYPGAQKAH